MSGSLLMSLATIESTTCILDCLISAADARLARRPVTTNSLNATVSPGGVDEPEDEAESDGDVDCAKAEVAPSATNVKASAHARGDILDFDTSSMVMTRRVERDSGLWSYGWGGKGTPVQRGDSNVDHIDSPKAKWATSN